MYIVMPNHLESSPVDRRRRSIDHQHPNIFRIVIKATKRRKLKCEKVEREVLFKSTTRQWWIIGAIDRMNRTLTRRNTSTTDEITQKYLFIHSTISQSELSISICWHGRCVSCLQRTYSSEWQASNPFQCTGFRTENRCGSHINCDRTWIAFV